MKYIYEGIMRLISIFVCLPLLIAVHMFIGAFTGIRIFWHDLNNTAIGEWSMKPPEKRDS